MSAKKTIILLFFGLSLAFILDSCMKDPFASEPAKLPPVTCEGKRTFGCLVNGELFSTDLFGSLESEYHYRGDFAGNFSIRAWRHGSQESVQIWMKDQVFHSGTYKLGFDAASIGSVSYANLKDDPRFYKCRSHMFGELQISDIDTVNGIICGTFSFDAVNEKNNQDTARIRNARFDLSF